MGVRLREAARGRGQAVIEITEPIIFGDQFPPQLRLCRELVFPVEDVDTRADDNGHPEPGHPARVGHGHRESHWV